MSENPNINCLAGWQCHKCGSYGPFRISASVRCVVLMTDDGTLEEDVSETEWSDHSWAECGECHYEATAGYFSNPRTVLDDIVEAVDG